MNDSERFLAKLCDETFLKLWSFPNLYRPDRPPKEVCDVLAVHREFIVLFSDKYCEIATDVPVEVAWKRWYKKAVHKSACQLAGAERWIRSDRPKLFMDPKCLVPLPIELPEPSTARIIRIAVARGATELCRAEMGGSGSMCFSPPCESPLAHRKAGGDEASPFVVGLPLGPEKFVHVLDDTTLPLLLSELDTAADLVRYLVWKEELVLSGRLIACAGEENLLGFYLSQGEVFSSADCAPSVPREQFVIGEGLWEELQHDDSYTAHQELVAPSYLWDEVVQRISEEVLAGQMLWDNSAGILGHEERVRCLAAPSRLGRLVLVTALTALLKDVGPLHPVMRRLTLDELPETMFALMVCPNARGVLYEEYRRWRIAMLEQYLFDALRTHTQVQEVVGYVVDSVRVQPEYSEDVLYVTRERVPETELGAIGAARGARLFMIAEGPSVGELIGIVKNSSRDEEWMRTGRNDPCPCESGKKFKKCCLAAVRDRLADRGTGG